MRTFIAIIFSMLGCIAIAAIWGVMPSEIGALRFVGGWVAGVVLFALGKMISEGILL